MIRAANRIAHRNDVTLVGHSGRAYATAAQSLRQLGEVPDGVAVLMRDDTGPIEAIVPIALGTGGQNLAAIRKLASAQNCPVVAVITLASVQGQPGLAAVLADLRLATFGHLGSCRNTPTQSSKPARA